MDAQTSPATSPGARNRTGRTRWKQVAARSEGALRLTPGVLYPLLHQMEAQGLLRSSWESVRAESGDGAGMSFLRTAL